MEHAALAAMRGTCSRAQVGVVIARNARILTTGYNGAPRHMPHCNHECTCTIHRLGEEDNSHESWCASQPPCKVSVHAEANAIAYAARYGIVLKDAVMYCTHMPCLNCAQLIINVGLVGVVYHTRYRLTDGLELLEAAGIQVDQQ